MYYDRNRNVNLKIKPKSINTGKNINFEEEDIESNEIIKNLNSNSIRQSGNSDVDVKVNVYVDTTAIGYAILCSLLATKQMSKEEFKAAVRSLEELTRKSFLGQGTNDPSKVRLYNNGLM